MRETITTYLVVVAAVLLSCPSVHAAKYEFTIEPTIEEISICEVEDADGKTYSKFETSSHFFIANIGMPDIPYEVRYIEVPTYSKDFKVKIKEVVTGISAKLESPIIPHQDNVSWNNFIGGGILPLDSNVMVCTETPKAYVIDDYFHDAERHIIKIAAPVYSYDALATCITPYTKIDLCLEYRICAPYEMKHRPSPGTLEVSACTILGPSPVLPDIPTDNAVLSGKNYHIITSSLYQDEFDLLVALKRSKGLNVRIHNIEEILSNTEGRDDAERLRNWMKKSMLPKYNRNYVLLVGGPNTNMPIRKFHRLSEYKDNNNGDTSFDSYYYVPTDRYFTDLSTDYPLSLQEDGINYSCGLDSISYSPSVAVGRIIVNNSFELRNYINKLVDYELYPGHGNTEYLSKGVAVRSYDAIDKNTQSLFNEFQLFGNVLHMNDNNASTYELLKPTGADVIREMSNAGITSIMGHGNPLQIFVAGKDSKKVHYIQPLSVRSLGTESQSGYENSFDLMGNCHSPGILYSIACSTVPLDSYLGQGRIHNMGTAFTTAGLFGGVAYIGNTRTGYSYSSDLEVEFGEWINTFPIGKAYLYSKNGVNAKPSNLLKANHCIYTNILIGDPNFRVWNGSPSIFNATYIKTSAGIELRSNSMQGAYVNINNGFTCIDSYYCGYNVDRYTLPFSRIECENDNGETGICCQFLLDKSNYLPFTGLVVDNALIKSRRYFVLNDRLNLDSSNAESITIGENGNLTFRCLQDFSSMGALSVASGGVLTIDSDKTVSLNNDKITGSGKLKITGSSISITGNFHADYGASFSISTN